MQIGFRAIRGGLPSFLTASWPVSMLFSSYARAMVTLSNPILIAFCGLIFAVGSVWAQAPSMPLEKKDAGYLLRLERVRYQQGVCVLLWGDGRYHLELHSPENVRIFEGTLDSGETRSLVGIVSGDQLYRLDQSQIENPFLPTGDDRVIVSVLRSGDKWQILYFPDAPSREPYRTSLNPLLDWLDRMEKRKGRKLSEEQGRNNCRPLVNPELTSRPAR